MYICMLIHFLILYHIQLLYSIPSLYFCFLDYNSRRNIYGFIHDSAIAPAIQVIQINVKATTEEGLGFTGEGLGISSQSICLIEKNK